MRYLSIRSGLFALDVFKMKVPGFNVRGKTQISSLMGSILSIVLLLLLLFYGANKFTHLMERRNPTITSYTEREAVTKFDVTNLRDAGIRFAFGIEGFLDKELKDDPAYVKWIVRQMGRLDGV